MTGLLFSRKTGAWGKICLSKIILEVLLQYCWKIQVVYALNLMTMDVKTLIFIFR